MNYFGQRDPRWANVKVGKTQRTLASIGCTTCCIADASSWFKIERRPDTLAKTLDYTADALIIWASLAKVGLKMARRFYRYDRILIADALKDPKKTVALNVDRGGHWVFALRELGFGRYWVHDPWYDRKSIYGGVVGGAVITKL